MISVLVVAEVRLYREGLAQNLDAEDDLQVVGTASTASEGVDRVRRLTPDVVVLDVSMPDSVAAVVEIVAAAPETKVVALAVPEDEESIVACAEARAAGCVTREASLPELVGAILSASRGEMLCSPRTAAALLRRVAALAGGPVPRRSASTLTAREREIAELIQEGLSNKEIAARLVLELPTVKNHVHNILEKLAVKRRTEVRVQLRSGSSVARI